MQLKTTATIHSSIIHVRRLDFQCLQRQKTIKLEVTNVMEAYTLKGAKTEAEESTPSVGNNCWKWRCKGKDQSFKYLRWIEKWNKIFKIFLGVELTFLCNTKLLFSFTCRAMKVYPRFDPTWGKKAAVWELLMWKNIICLLSKVSAGLLNTPEMLSNHALVSKYLPLLILTLNTSYANN